LSAAGHFGEAAPVLSHLIYGRQIGNELSEEEIRTEKQSSQDPLSRDSRRKHGKKRAAGRGVHAAARSVGFAMLVRRYANVLERVALALGGLDPLRNILR
jgi:hypothetical protein